MLFILTGISTPVIGALVRYKVPGLLFLIIVINLMYDQLKNIQLNRISVIVTMFFFLVACKEKLK